MERAGYRWAYPRHRRRHGGTPDRNQFRLTTAVDFDGHGIGKLLVPLIVRRQAQKEMPANVEALKRRVEGQQPQHPA